MSIYHIDFHHHVMGDPVDRLRYSVFDLIDRAVQKGLHAIAITPHGEVFENRKAELYAKEQGLLLISGVEKRIEGKEVLILNVSPHEIPTPMTFHDLRALREKRGNEILTIAPHPFYPSNACMGSLLDDYEDLIDGIEYAHLHLSFYNPNDQAVEWARLHRKPILANSDTHALFMVGRNFTQAESLDLSIDSIFKSIRQNRLKTVVHLPSVFEVVRFIFQISAMQFLLRYFSYSRQKSIAIVQK